MSQARSASTTQRRGRSVSSASAALKTRLGPASGGSRANGAVENSQGKLRDECLIEQVFATLAGDSVLIKRSRRDYSWGRLHTAHGGLIPAAVRLNAAESLRNLESSGARSRLRSTSAKEGLNSDTRGTNGEQVSDCLSGSWRQLCTLGCVWRSFWDRFSGGRARIFVKPLVNLLARLPGLHRVGQALDVGGGGRVGVVIFRRWWVTRAIRSGKRGVVER